QDGEVEGGALEELARPRLRFAVVHREHREWLSREALLQPLHRRHLLAAGLAPRRPEVHEDDLAPVVGERVLAAGEVAEREGRRLDVVPGDEAALVSLPAGN